MHPIGRWPSDHGHRAPPPLETSSDPVATARQHDARAPFSDRQRTHLSPTSESIRALTPAASTTAADRQPRRARARQRRRAQRVESDVGNRPQPARGTPSPARRPHRLADRLARALLRRPADTRNGRMAGVRLCPRACPTSRDFPMVEPNRAGIIIRRSQIDPCLRHHPKAPQKGRAGIWRAVRRLRRRQHVAGFSETQPALQHHTSRGPRHPSRAVCLPT